MYYSRPQLRSIIWQQRCSPQPQQILAALLQGTLTSHASGVVWYTDMHHGMSTWEMLMYIGIRKGCAYLGHAVGELLLVCSQPLGFMQGHERLLQECLQKETASSATSK